MKPILILTNTAWAGIMVLAQVEPTPSIIAAVTAVAITAGLICQIVLQLMARREAREREEKRIAEAKAAAEKLAAETKMTEEKRTAEANRLATEIKQAAEKAAAEVHEVKTTLQAVQGLSEGKLDKILIHVNTAMETQLRLRVDESRTRYEATKGETEKKILEQAEEALAAHLRGQKVIDENVPKGS